MCGGVFYQALIFPFSSVFIGKTRLKSKIPEEPTNSCSGDTIYTSFLYHVRFSHTKSHAEDAKSAENACDARVNLPEVTYKR